MEAAAASIRGGDDLDVLVTIRNRGARAGREVVQLYLEGPDSDPGSPIRVLAGFASVEAEPGAQVALRVSLHSRAFERSDHGPPLWATPPAPPPISPAPPPPHPTHPHT